MQASRPHANEQLRLATLYALDILDSGEEERFDQYARIASSLLGLPIALISLADAERQCFKSHIGLNLSETPRGSGICTHTIDSGELTVVEDTLADRRFADNPMVTGGPRIRFYAGCPLIAENGTVIGSLCVAGKKPRKFSADERQSLIDLADLVERELTNTAMREDPDTGLLNRDGFLTLAEQALQICRRQKLPFTLVRLRLHEGDCVVRPDGAPATRLAAMLQASVGPADLVGKVSTRDLAIALCDKNLQQASSLLDAISGNERLSHPDMQAICSHGVHAVAIPYSGEATCDVTGMLQQAFRRMRNSSTNIVESTRTG